jgi:hypothetical protein
LNKTTVSLRDYVNCVKTLQPGWAVTPIEEINTLNDGKKKVHRAVQHSISAFNDILSQSADLTQWIAPCVVEDPQILTGIPESTPVMLFGGQSMKPSSAFDAVRQICKRKGPVGWATGDPISVIIGTLAGVSFFESDFALDLAA